VAQPEYVLPVRHDMVRVTERLPPPGSWKADRPGEIVGSGPQHTGLRQGVAGPDQGYVLTLASRLHDRLVLGPGEKEEDAVSGCSGVALRRAALFGRAPVIHDVELAFTLWGFMTGAPQDLIDYRRPRFAEVAHHYAERRDIADAVSEEALRLTPADVAGRLANGGWRTLLGVSG
jgi:hypothetical protein